MAAAEGVHLEEKSLVHDVRHDREWDAPTYIQLTRDLRKHLDRQALLCLGLREFLDRRPTPLWPTAEHGISVVQVRTYQSLLRGMEISASNMIRLTAVIDDSLRDCFSIARSVVETGINAAFIAARGYSAAEEARRHSLFRCVRDLDRRLRIGHIEIHRRSRCLDQPDDVPGLCDVLEQIADEAGAELTAWTPLSVTKRLQVVLSELGESIAGQLAEAYFHAYRDASEVLHGSVYGCLLSFGRTMRDQETALLDCACSLLFDCCMALNRAVWAIGLAHKLDQVADRANGFDLLLFDIPMFADAYQAARRERACGREDHEVSC